MTKKIIKKIIEKAHEWYGKEELVGKPEKINWVAPETAIDVGCIVAIEYISNKFTGRKKIYRHEVETEKRLYLSPDGSTLIVDPPFTITARGIED